jgi:hypothetical protein
MVPPEKAGTDGGDETKANEIAIVSLDGRPVHLMTPWEMHVQVATDIDDERDDVAGDTPRQRAPPCDDRAQLL